MRITLSIIFIFGFLLSMSQEAVDTAALSRPDMSDIEASLNKKKVRFNLEFGTTFGAGRFGSYFGTYVAPNISYPLTDRFMLSAGGYFSGISPVAQGEGMTAFGYPYANLYSRSFLYVSGAYRLTDNLTVTGTAYREINPFGAAQLPAGFSTEARGFIMGVDYRIGEHIFIRGEVEVREGYQPYHFDPFMNPTGRRMNNPFFYGP